MTLKRRFTFSFILLGLLLLPLISAAESAHFNKSGLPLPRFASLRTNEVNVRTGPGVKYPLEWIFIRKDLPVKITAEFEHWRQIKDWQGNEGWVHKVMLSGHRTILFTDKSTPLFAQPNEEAKIIVLVETNIIANFKGCESDWCQVQVQNFKGWVQKHRVWGILPDEGSK
jgi:SH3-like domain-containing protein